VQSQGHDSSWDLCEDITAYALSIVSGLQIPEDEQLEKEVFCRELEGIVKQIRPSISLLLPPDKTKSQLFLEFCCVDG
jgi:hypothetical protein